MRYSALITCFNSLNPVLAIESALAQTVKPYEIIVVDDCSSDDYGPNLEQLAKRFGCNYLRTPSNLGPAGARNLGISIAKTDVIMIFDDDDVSLPIRAAVHIENLRSGTQLSYVSSRKIYPNGYSFDAVSSNYFGSIKPIELSQFLLAGKSSENFPKIHVPACCLAFKKESFDAQGFFDSNLRRLEDVDFALMASKKGLIFSFSEVIGVTRFASEGSDKNATIESTAQINLLSKYRSFFDERDFKKMSMWYQIRAYYFLRNYINLIKVFFLFTLRFGVEWRKIHNSLSRILHDYRKDSKGNLDG
jgi:glycosyltransferase involved in cell wall biosynthesis